MDAQLRTRAEARLHDAAERLGLLDPRPPYRERLRQLREKHDAAFDRAITHYETNVLPDLTRADDPLAVWLEYGSFLARLTSEGRAWRVDASGRASSLEPPLASGDMVLFVPEDTSSDVLVMAEPKETSRAQAATLDLLVRRKLAL